MMQTYSSLTALKEQKQQVGFKVRATKDALIVTEVTDDLRFVVGDEITALLEMELNIVEKISSYFR